MQLPPWAIIVIGTTLVLVIVFGVLQVLWIRNKLTSIQKASYNHELDTRRLVSQDVDIQNRLQVYGLVLNCKATSVLNTILFESIKPFAIPKIVNIPHVCGSVMKSLNVNVQKVGFLAVKTNEGADQLAQDIVSQKTRYIVINGQLLLIDYDSSKSRDTMIQTIIDANIRGTSDKISQLQVFFVYALGSIQNKLVDVDKSLSSCKPDIKSFMGTPSYASSQEDTQSIDVQAMLGYHNDAIEMPLHTLGYRVL